MFWLRTLAYLMPLALGFGGFLLVREVERLELPPPGGSLVTAIQEPIGSLSPFGAEEGVTREIRDLIFDPVLVRDADFELQPHLLDSWQFRTIVTLHCASEEDAGEVEARIRSGEYRPGARQSLANCDREEEILTLTFPDFAESIEKEFLDQIPPEQLANFKVVVLTVDHSIETFLEAFLTSSIEKKRIRMIDFDDDRQAMLFLDGDIDPFLEELGLYLDSNSDLNPRVERQGEQSHFLAREAIFRFRDDVFWHDGEKLTAEDVLFSLDKFAGEDANSPLRGLFWFAESIDLRNRFEVRFLLKSLPSPELMLECWEQLPIVPRHRFEGMESGEAWATFQVSPTGTGPYQVMERFRDGGIRLRANEAYWLGIPEQEDLVYRRFDSLESKLLALSSYRIDALVPDERFVLWAQRNPGEVEKAKSVSRFQHFVVWNRDQDPYSEKDFRVALAEAVDPSAWTREESDSFLQPVRGLFHPRDSWDPGPLALLRYDVAAAADRLDELGFRYDEARGIRRDQEGKPLEIELLVNQQNAHQGFLAASLASQWQALGIQVKIEELPLSSILMERLLPRRFGAILLSWEIPKGRDRYRSFHSQGGGEGGTNLFGLADPGIDEAIETLRDSHSREEVQEAAKTLQDRIIELQPCLFLAESGRLVWYREGAIKAVPPPSVDLEGERFPFLGQEGVTRSRPWWVREERLNPEDSGELR